MAGTTVYTLGKSDSSLREPETETEDTQTDDEKGRDCGRDLSQTDRLDSTPSKKVGVIIKWLPTATPSRQNVICDTQ